MNENSGANRIWELDFFRGIAIILMIYFHLIYDMKEFFGYDANYEGNFTYYIGKLSAVLFIIISGISTSLSRSSLKRGLKVLGAGLIITIASYLFNKDYFVVFGILHFLGLSMMLSVMVKKLDNFTLLAAGVIIIVLGYALPLDHFSNDYLMIFGFKSQTFSSSDYYPLFPYFGIFLLGMVLGRLLYANRRSLFKPLPGHHMLCIAGRHSLLVYLIHQPVILLILYLISQVRRI